MRQFYMFIMLILVNLSVVKAQEVSDFFLLTDTFFKEYVSNGKIDYATIKNHPETLNSLMLLAEKVDVGVENKKIYQAFWINAYNLSVVKGIINNYPIKSPLDISGFFDTAKYSLAGKKVTLNQIENELLRAQFKDPRFHFVLVCGAVSCPPIIAKAYMPETLEKQLEEQTKLAINGNYFIKIITKKKLIEGSEILKWYKEDFTMNGTTEIDFFNKYLTQKIPASFKLKYTTYNWSLNTQ